MSKKSSRVAFIPTLYEIVSNPANHHIVEWNEAGDGFFIKNLNDFKNKLLQQHYGHSNFDNFVRQLNYYGFRKNSHQLEYRQPEFLRGQKNKAALIKRKNSEAGVQVKSSISTLQTQIAELRDQYDDIHKTQIMILKLISSFVPNNVAEEAMREIGTMPQLVRSESPQSSDSSREETEDVDTQMMDLAKLTDTVQQLPKGKDLLHDNPIPLQLNNVPDYQGVSADWRWSAGGPPGGPSPHPSVLDKLKLEINSNSGKQKDFTKVTASDLSDWLTAAKHRTNGTSLLYGSSSPRTTTPPPMRATKGGSNRSHHPPSSSELGERPHKKLKLAAKTSDFSSITSSTAVEEIADVSVDDGSLPAFLAPLEPLPLDDYDPVINQLLSDAPLPMLSHPLDFTVKSEHIPVVKTEPLTYFASPVDLLMSENPASLSPLPGPMPIPSDLVLY